MADQRREDPVLITDAQMSYEEELEIRKRRYKWTMGMRIPCMILAGVFYQIPWVAVTLLAISVPLPWIAVLIANDRLPRKAETPNRHRQDHRAIEARPHQVIDQGGDAPRDPGAGPDDAPSPNSTGSSPAGGSGAGTGNDTASPP
ncbi:DUF3099 domain-containing protein [Pseudonocardia sp. ICBG1293]|uniref:DUF3099 domain-containing protein n=1 Tax=Pseudonocardia sp. ICBG1293 TaxID=2844382 RepID=UPI0027DF563B|nr:DUF3099 domain-containing protein [Pseudonocardia sp. ICBG1293]